VLEFCFVCVHRKRFYRGNLMSDSYSAPPPTASIIAAQPRLMACVHYADNVARLPVLDLQQNWDGQSAVVSSPAASATSSAAVPPLVFLQVSSLPGRQRLCKVKTKPLARFVVAERIRARIRSGCACCSVPSQFQPSRPKSRLSELPGWQSTCSSN